MNLLKYNGISTNKIIQLFEETFTNSEGASEGKVIANLVNDLLNKTDKAVTRVFVAQESEQMVGCIIFSTLKFCNNDIKAFLLSPVAVHPEYQRKGIGQRLIRFGHEELKKEGTQLVVTYGDINFYSKVGYQHVSEEVLRAPLRLSYPEGWIAQLLTQKAIMPIGQDSTCVEALNNQLYW